MSCNVTLNHWNECAKYFFLVFFSFTCHSNFSFNPLFSQILGHREPSALLSTMKPCLVCISNLLINVLYTYLCFVFSAISEDPSNWTFAIDTLNVALINTSTCLPHLFWQSSFTWWPLSSWLQLFHLISLVMTALARSFLLTVVDYYEACSRDHTIQLNFSLTPFEENL